jgi:p-hydroxybenzoate 3-monooxygenase
VVVDDRTRAEIENTVRAGILEAGSVRLLTETGVGDRVRRDGIAHEGISLRFGGEDHRIDFKDLVGESAWLYLVGADGSRSICRFEVPEMVRAHYFREYPFAWFAILAEAPKSAPEGTSVSSTT